MTKKKTPLKLTPESAQKIATMLGKSLAIRDRVGFEYQVGLLGYITRGEEAQKILESCLKEGPFQTDIHAAFRLQVEHLLQRIDELEVEQKLKAIEES